MFADRIQKRQQVSQGREGESERERLTEGQVEPSPQHSSPAHIAPAWFGQGTLAPNAQVAGGAGGAIHAGGRSKAVELIVLALGAPAQIH